jgi:hypothetical protein
MIVFPQGLVASEAAAGRPLTHARIGWDTHTRDLDIAAVTASSEGSTAPRDAPLRADTAEYWEPTALPATWLVDLGSGLDIDYVGLVGRFGSVSAAVLVETSDGTLGGSPSALIYTTFASEVMPADDAPLLFLDTSRVARYVRITLTGSGDLPRLAVAYVGQILAMPRPVYGGHAPMPLQRQTVLAQSLSRGGNFLGQGFRRHGVVGAVQYRHLDPDFVRDELDAFVQAARRYPFFFAWRPADWPLEVAYAWSPEDIRPSNMGVRELMQVGWNMQGVGHE